MLVFDPNSTHHHKGVDSPHKRLGGVFGDLGRDVLVDLEANASWGEGQTVELVGARDGQAIADDPGEAHPAWQDAGGQSLGILVITGGDFHELHQLGLLFRSDDEDLGFIGVNVIVHELLVDLQNQLKGDLGGAVTDDLGRGQRRRGAVAGQGRGRGRGDNEVISRTTHGHRQGLGQGGFGFDQHLNDVFLLDRFTIMPDFRNRNPAGPGRFRDRRINENTGLLRGRGGADPFPVVLLGAYADFADMAAQTGIGLLGEKTNVGFEGFNVDIADRRGHLYISLVDS